MSGSASSAAPAILSNAGRTKSTNVTNAETGLPGSPKTWVFPPSSCAAVEERLARPHANAPQIEAHSGGGQAFLDEIPLADGNAARDDERIVRAKPGGELGVEVVAGVAGAFEDRDRRAEGGRQRGEQDAVALVDFARAEGLTGRAELVARGQDGDAWAAADGDRGETLGCQQAETARREAVTSGEDTLTPRQIVTRPPDELPGGDGFLENDHVPRALDILLHDHRPRAHWHRSAGKNPHRAAGFHPQTAVRTGGLFTVHD